MDRRVDRVAVLGSGVMGSAIAAHFANAGIPSLVLDIVPRELSAAESAAGLTLDDRRVRDRIARDSVKALTRTRPAPHHVRCRAITKPSPPLFPFPQITQIFLFFKFFKSSFAVPATLEPAFSIKVILAIP